MELELPAISRSPDRWLALFGRVLGLIMIVGVVWMSRYRNEISPGMRVVDSDDNELGYVAEVNGTFFKIQPPSGATIQVQLDAIQNVLGETVRLSITASQTSRRTR